MRAAVGCLRSKDAFPAKTRVAATALSFALCFVYLLFLPFHAWGLAALIAVCAFLLTSLGQSGDVGARRSPPVP